MLIFLIHEVVTLAALSASALLLGTAVIRYGVKVNYTRKVLRILLLVIPLALLYFWPYTPSATTCLLKGCVLTGMFFGLSSSIRSRFWPSRICFAALDRPEDRPHTILLLTTQSAACFAVIIFTAWWLDFYNAQRLLLIGLLVDGLGDALAEPVGIAFGRFRYRTRSLFSNVSQWRTLEGSACVFLSAVLAIFLVRDVFSPAELWLAFLMVPLLVTLAEAYSPHTWDGPFLYFTSAAGCIVAIELGQLLSATR